MTPLMLSALLWKAAHPGGAAYPTFDKPLAGALLKLHAAGLIVITDLMRAEYVVSKTGHDFVKRLQGTRNGPQ